MKQNWALIDTFGNLPDANNSPFYILETFPGCSKFKIPSTDVRTDLTLSTRLPSIQPQLLNPLIEFHRQNVTEYHYFFYHDYPKFFTTDLLMMSEDSEALRNAVAAFSALVYSTKYYSARELAFVYYDFAVVELRHALGAFKPDEYHVHIVIATAMTLATFDVIFHPYLVKSPTYLT